MSGIDRYCFLIYGRIRSAGGREYGGSGWGSVHIGPPRLAMGQSGKVHTKMKVTIQRVLLSAKLISYLPSIDSMVLILQHAEELHHRRRRRRREGKGSVRGMKRPQ